MNDTKLVKTLFKPVGIDAGCWEMMCATDEMYLVHTMGESICRDGIHAFRINDDDIPPRQLGLREDEH